MPHTCVLKVCWKGTHKSHFVLKTGSDIHDPLLTGPVTLEGWSQVLKKSGRVTSFLPVKLLTGDEALDELLSEDFFGTEGQCDPRGDHRD
jgi:hypothetical protein